MTNNAPRTLFLAVRDHYANGVRLLASLLHEHGYEADLLMFKEFSMALPPPMTEKEWELCETAVREYAPALIGVSLTSIPVVDEPRFFAMLRRAAPGSLIVCGGFGPTFEPERFLKAGADYVVCGEGEGAMLDLVRALATGDDIRKIQNMAWLDGNDLQKNPLRPLEDLRNTPPFLSGDEHIMLIENNELRHVDPMLTQRGLYPICSSRGCVGRCTYCSGGNWLSLYRQAHGHIKRYRVRPVEKVLEECEQAKAKGASYLLFLDEYFVRPEEEFFYFFREYKRRVGLPFGLMVHTAFLDKSEERFRAFFEAGIHDVEIGVQSASRHIAYDIFQRKVSLELQLRTINRLHRHWVSSSVDFITGHVLESEQDLLDTAAFIKELPFDPAWPARTSISVFNLSLLPGAPLGSLFPELRTRSMPQKEKEFRQRILYLRHILKDDDEFFSIYANKALRAEPHLLGTVFRETFARLYADFWRATLRRLEGKEVFFWGAGHEYQMHKHWFRHTRPRAMLLDVPSPLHEIDGLPVMHPDEALRDADETPIIMFTQTPGVIATKVLRRYPGYTDLLSCHHASYRTLFLA